MKRASAPGRGRPRGFDTEWVLEQAMTVFWQHGYEGASLSDLQDATGLTPPSIYNAFGSKQQLYRACLDHYNHNIGSHVTAPLRAPTATRDGMRRVLHNAAKEFTAVHRPAGCMISTAALTMGGQHTDIGDEVAGRRSGTLSAFANYLVRAQKNGELTSEIRADELARYFGAVIQGMSAQARDGASQSDLENIADLAMKAWPSRGMRNSIRQ